MTFYLFCYDNDKWLFNNNYVKRVIKARGIKEAHLKAEKIMHTENFPFKIKSWEISSKEEDILL